jgi:hypothetical protein
MSPGPENCKIVGPIKAATCALLALDADSPAMLFLRAAQRNIASIRFLRIQHFSLDANRPDLLTESLALRTAGWLKTPTSAFSIKHATLTEPK